MYPNARSGPIPGTTLTWAVVDYHLRFGGMGLPGGTSLVEMVAHLQGHSTRPELTWDGKNCRWRKFYKGQRYVISCRQLNRPNDREASYLAAREWWRAKEATIRG